MICCGGRIIGCISNASDDMKAGGKCFRKDTWEIESPSRHIFTSILR
jgi:hypothetical protein